MVEDTAKNVMRDEFTVEQLKEMVKKAENDCVSSDGAASSSSYAGTSR